MLKPIFNQNQVTTKSGVVIAQKMEDGKVIILNRYFKRMRHTIMEHFNTTILVIVKTIKEYTEKFRGEFKPLYVESTRSLLTYETILAKEFLK